MTVINPNSISGITSITLPAGADNVLTIHTNDGVERFRIDSSGNVKVGSAATISPDGDLFVTGVTNTGGHFAGSGANLTNLTAGNLTGALPAISGANLTGIAATDNVRTGILDVAGIATFRDTVNIPNINGGQIGGRRNLIINGAMQVAQRGTSASGSSANGFSTVDRFAMYQTGTDDYPETEQGTVASGTTPYTNGFRNSFKITNGNQSSGGQAGDYLYISHKIEAQDMAQCGWNYTSTSSFVTLSFWVKSSVAQNFYGYLKTADGTSQNYPFETGSLSANTWTKITKTIPGNSNLQFDINVNMGIEFVIGLFFGTDYTGSITLNQWGTWSSSNRAPDYGSSNDDWFETNDATFELTGVQLEVGSQATSFEHLSFGEERLLCQRYYQDIAGNSDLVMWGSGRASGTTNALVNTPLSVPLRASPTISQTSYTTWGTAGSHSVDNDTPTVQYFHANNTFLPMNFHSTSSLTNARVATVACKSGSSLVMDAEM